MGQAYAQDMQQISFAGQQDGERILYTVKPHWLMEAGRDFRGILLAAILFFSIWQTSKFLPAFNNDLVNYSYFTVAVLLALLLWWNARYCRNLRSYITDRRIVRFEPIFPIMEKRRTLFWKEVTKTRGIAKNFFWRAINIGTLEVAPMVVEGGGSILMPYVWYFEDLASYLDKIINTVKYEQGDILSLRPFVTKPKGKRYEAAPSL